MSAVWMLVITLETGVSQCGSATCMDRETTIEFPTQDRYECQNAIDEIMRAADLPKGVALKVYCQERKP